MIGKRFVRVNVVVATLTWIPVAAFAQAGSAIAGVVRDTTGAVLPGVTVEAASPSLLEKVRTAVTDNQGQYKVVDLVPGTYTVTFRLPGFNTVTREGVELTASFTATVNADLRVGALEETVTVSGQSPVVDVQNVTQRTVVNKDVLAALPTSRNIQGIAQTIPGITVGRVTRPSGQDVGGLAGERNTLMIHGSRSSDFNSYLEGLPYGAMNGSWASTGYTVNPAEVQEFSYNLGAAPAEYASGGAAINVIPRVGSNRFEGMFFGNFTTSSLQSDNLEGLPNRSTVNRLVKTWDIDLAIGGPIKRDKLWFFAAGRHFGIKETLANAYYSKDPAAFVRVPDLSRPAEDATRNRHEGLRLTWQATPKNKISVYFQDERRAATHYTITSSISPEAVASYSDPVNHFLQASWNSPVTNRLLFEAGTLLYTGTFPKLSAQPEIAPDALSVQELSTGLLYRAARSYSTTTQDMNHFRGGATYVTGSHAFKVGFTLSAATRVLWQRTQGDLNLQFLNGIPRTVIQNATPFTMEEDLNAMLGLYAQDQWTIGRVTVNAGVRYDYLNESVPAQHEPAGQFVTARDFDEIKDVPNWHDIGPRLGVAYDLFGTGKTAVKVTLGRYVANEAVDFARANNPVNTSVNSASRTWGDADGNYYPNCNFLIPGANGECGAISNVNFGKPNITTVYDDALRSGRDARAKNWEVTAALQHELMPRVSANLGYFRRWFGNFTVTDNLAVTPADFAPYCITAPADSRLPGGGGNEICGLYDVNPAKFGQVSNLVTFASNYGKQREQYDGIDLTMNARLPRGAQVQGGLNMGRAETNNCFTVDSPQQLQFCDLKPPFQPQVRLFGMYPLPGDFLASGTFQSLPGPQITATYTVTNTQIRPSLGRNLASGANGTATIELIEPGTLYGERLYQIDLRISKLIKVGRIRTQANFDMYNALNVNPVLVLNTTFGPAWQQPTYVLPGRLIKFGVQVDF